MHTIQLHSYISSVIDDVDGYAIDVLYYHIRKVFLENKFSLKGFNDIEISDKYLQVPTQVNLYFDYSSPQRCIALLMSLRAIILNPSFFKKCENDDLFFKPFCQDYFSWIRYSSVIINNENDPDFYNLFCILEDFEYDKTISESHLEQFKEHTVQPLCRNLDNHYRKIAESHNQNTKDVIIDNAFLDDSSLIEYTVPEEIEYIGNTAFSYCKNLTKITFLRADTLFGKFPIIECPLLKSIVVSEGSEDYYKEQLYFYKDIIVATTQTQTNEEKGKNETESIEDNHLIAEAHNHYISPATEQSESKAPVIDKTTPDIEIQKIQEIFKNKSTTYKFFWFIAILDIIKEKEELSINYSEILAKMIALAWPFIQQDLVFGPSDSLPNIIHSLLITNCIQIHNNEKKVEQVIYAKYNEKKILRTLSPLSKNVPYRFLSPWIKYTTDKEVRETSQSVECATPYALYEDYIILDESWFDYFNGHYQELRDMAKHELIEYLKKYNNGLKLLKFIVN